MKKINFSVAIILIWVNLFTSCINDEPCELPEVPTPTNSYVADGFLKEYPKHCQVAGIGYISDIGIYSETGELFEKSFYLDYLRGGAALTKNVTLRDGNYEFSCYVKTNNLESVRFIAYRNDAVSYKDIIVINKDTYKVIYGFKIDNGASNTMQVGVTNMVNSLDLNIDAVNRYVYVTGFNVEMM